MEDATRMRRCPQCGADLPIDAPEGLCPACLMAAAAAGSPVSGDDSTVLSPNKGSGTLPGSGPRLATGQSFGPYRIGRLLGRGGMGDVYEAEHVEQGRRVALKLLNSRLTSAADRARFLREGQLAASINHPHSVYIFGSEEIAGAPVITMELLPGGTLKDRVQKDGPLPPAQAVEAILQVIAGLDAARAAGILHRDVKPANCFIDRDGTVKVGDFGLSISTAARDVSQITDGTFQGTPQYAAPEQLRGETLDVRADIYAVGVTLYYLLTSHLPFDDKDLTTLVARIKTERPRSPRAFRKSVPRALARIVLRCLAKDREERIQTYAVLADSLRPFRAAAPTPATMGLRFLAGAIDHTILMVPLTPLNVMLMFNGAAADLIQWLYPLQLAAIVAYYGLQEGITDATIGKRLLRLRVTDVNGQPAGVARAHWRALLFHAPMILATLPQWILGPERAFQLLTDLVMGSALGLGSSILTALLFVTVRRRNRLAGIHELLSGTRVERRLDPGARPALDVVAAVTAPGTAVTGAPRYGPYEVTGIHGTTGAGDLLAGFDSTLRRAVWIHAVKPGVPAVVPVIRDLGRRTRLRWLSGRRSERENWDAYEACDGAPFSRVIAGRQPWRSVKHWLHDLASELDFASRDDMLPALALDRVWITRDGHAMLLDFPVLSGPASESPTKPDLPANAFLVSISDQALGRETSAGTTLGTSPLRRLPLSATSFLQKLRGGGYSSTPEIVAGAGALMSRADEVSRWRRALAVVSCAALPIVPGLFVLMMGTLLQLTWTPEVAALNGSLAYLQRQMSREPSAERAAVEVYIASRFGRTLSDEKFWSNPVAAAIVGPRRQLAERVMANHPTVTPGELALALPSLGNFLDEVQAYEARPQFGTGVRSILPMVAGLLVCVALAGLVGAFVCRSGLMLALCGIAVVTAQGTQVSRFRALGRAFVAWAPAFLVFYVLFQLWKVHSDWQVATVLGALLFPVGALWAVWRPERGLQDLIARTWLVPR